MDRNAGNIEALLEDDDSSSSDEELEVVVGKAAQKVVRHDIIMKATTLDLSTEDALNVAKKGFFKSTRTR